MVDGTELPRGSGGHLSDAHVICPACAHNFTAVSPASQARANELLSINQRLVDALERKEPPTNPACEGLYFALAFLGLLVLLSLAIKVVT